MAAEDGALPENRRQLYRSVLVHERVHWANMFGDEEGRRPEPDMFDSAPAA